MTVLAWVAASSSPGVTISSLLAAAGCGRPVTLVEAAVTGGTLPGLGLRWNPGLVSLAASFPERITGAVLAEHSQMTAVGVPVVVGAPSGPEAAACMARLALPLAAWLPEPGSYSAGAGEVLVVDCGTVAVGGELWPVAVRADLTVIVVRQSDVTEGETAARIGHAHALAVSLAAGGARLAAVVVGERPYPASEITAALGIPVAAMLPLEPAVASMMAHGWAKAGRRRTVLEAAARKMGATLLAIADSPAGADDVEVVA